MIAEFKLALTYVKSDVKRVSRQFSVGLATVAIVTWIITFLHEASIKSPIIFLAFTEFQVGENDVILVPNFSDLHGEQATTALINRTYVEHKLSEVHEVDGMASRWIFLGRVSQEYSETEVETLVLGIDSAKEREQGFGRAWKDIDTLEGNECYIMDQITRQISLDDPVGKDIWLRFGMADVVAAISDGAIIDQTVEQMKQKLIEQHLPIFESECVRLQFGAFPPPIRWELSNAYVQPNLTAVNPDTRTPPPGVAKFKSWGVGDETGSSCIFVEPTFDCVNLSLTQLDAPPTTPINFTVRWENWNPSTEGDYECTKASCFWNKYQENKDWGYYDDLGGDCKACTDRCDTDSNCWAVECGGDYCSWWKPGICKESDADSFGQNTCRTSTLGHCCDECTNMQLGCGFSNSSYEVFQEICRNSTAPKVERRMNFPELDSYIDSLIAIFTAGAFMETGVQRQKTEEIIAALEEFKASSHNVTIDELLHNAVEMGIVVTELLTEVKIARTVKDGQGKWPLILGSVLVIDTEALNAIISQDLKDNLPIFKTTLETFIATTDKISEDMKASILSMIDNFDSSMVGQIGSHFKDFTMEVLLLAKDRVNTYLKSYNDVRSDMIDFTNAISNGIGYNYSVTYQVPITQTMMATQFLRYMLDSLLLCCLALMIFITSLVIYAVILIDVEQSTYTYGMLRALGMKKFTLVTILLTKAMTFTLPAIMIGLFFAFLSSIPVTKMMNGFSHLSLPYTMAGSSVAWGTFVALFITIFSSVQPTSVALSSSLRDALDITHFNNKSVQITMKKLEDVGISGTQFVIGVILTIVGFVACYLIPYAFTFLEWGLYFNITCFIVLFMSLGLIVVASAISGPLERAVLWCMMYPTPFFKLHDVVRKNMFGHEQKNAKTLLLFTSCIFFVVFSGSVTEFVTNGVLEQIKLISGAEGSIIVPASTLCDAVENCRFTSILAYLQAQKEEGIIAEYATMTMPIDDQSDHIDSIQVSTLGNFPNTAPWIVGVSENWVDTIYDDYVRITENNAIQKMPQSRNGKDDVISLLYDQAGNCHLDMDDNKIPQSPHLLFTDIEYDQQNMTTSYENYLDAIISGAMADTIGSRGIEDPLMFRVLGPDLRYLLKPRAMVAQFPGVFMTSLKQFGEMQHLLVSMPSFERLFNEIGSQRDHILIQKVLFRFTKQASKTDREDVFGQISNYVTNPAVPVLNIQLMIEQSETWTSIIQTYFLIFGMVGTILSFFLLSLSFWNNVKNNAWELAVLRALGINRTQITMIYIFEALSIIFSCMILGTIIGLIIASSLIGQFTLFLNTSLHIDFPFGMFFSQCALALIAAVVGSFLPIHEFCKQPVARNFIGA